MIETKPNQSYLGDGLYASYDGYQIELNSSNGIEYTNSVFLEPVVLRHFFEYIEAVCHLKISITKIGVNPNE